jgi:hypothetical protein
MISRKKLEEQLKRINFHYTGWGRSEVNELTNVLMSDEELEECVNGYYEAGFALLVATKERVLLIDKKPLGYLTVEDMRFDMINEMDLHHRLVGAQIRIASGSKTLFFTSLNQNRLRRLLHYVQARMVQIKKDASDHQQEQKQHLEEMNEQLRLYLMAAHKQQFVDQAHAIQAGHMYGQPAQQTWQYEAIPVAAQHLQMPEPQPHRPVATDNGNSQPATPFEQVAAAAFEQQTEPPIRQDTRMTPEPAAARDRSPVPQMPMAHILTEIPKYSHEALEQVAQIVTTPQQVGLAAARRVVPIISAYTRLPLMSRRRRYGPSEQT